MSESIPQFGRRVQGASYIDRPGVYGIIIDPDGRVAVVRAGNEHFLPGGGISPGETLEQAMDREAREECGRSAAIIRIIGRADQHCSTRSGKHFTKLCTYVQARFIPGSECEPIEADHELIWMTPDVAIEQLMLDADRWAVQSVFRR